MVDSTESIPIPYEKPSISFTYDQLKSWYDQLRVRRLQPALDTAQRYLKEMMEENLSDFDRRRIQLRSGRIKSPARLWEKLNQPKYISSIQSLDDIPSIIDDLVGIRIICNNTSDIDVVQTMLSSLPDLEEEATPTIAFEPTKERLYHENPKPSGYRAYHVNLSVSVGSGIEYSWKRVSVELQVRTLLQEGWGELTHEDTYKPGSELPPLIKVLARRMANLLSCVDELAQDLRDELDRQGTLRLVAAPEESAMAATAPSIAGQPAPAPEDSFPAAGDTLPPFPEEALLEETRAIVSSLEKPETLANIAFRLQTLFGNHISRQHWGRFGSFKGLLLEAVPAVHIESVGPSWVLPPGFTRDDIPGGATELNDQFDADVPDIIRTLRPFERYIPAVSSEELDRYLNSAAAALDSKLWDDLEIPRNGLGIQQIHLLSKAVRDRVQLGGNPLKRQKLSYILISLLNSGNLRPGLGVDDIRAIFESFLIARIGYHGLEVTDNDRAAIAEWLGT